MKAIKLVIWDWNGTLLNDVDVCISTINTLLARHGYTPLSGKEEYRQKFQFPIKEYYQKLGIDFARTPFDALAAEYMKLYHSLSETCPLQPESLSTLSLLHQQGVRQVLLSASMQEHLLMQTGRYPLSPYFEQFLGIRDIYAKSKLELARSFVAACGCNADEVLFVGDSVHDFEVAAGCGCKSVLYCNGHQSCEALASTGAPVIERLGLLCDFIARADAE